MSGRLAVDFGTSNTVLAVWDEVKQEGVPLHLSEYGRRLTYRHGSAPIEKISIVPSLIHYAADGRRWLGNQVLDQNLYDSERTVRWMKRYIGRRTPLKVRFEGREISHNDAGRDFLSAILTFAAAELHFSDEEIAFTVPVEAFEHYCQWLTEVAEGVGMPRYRLIDEASAAALGNGVTIRPGDVYLIFDFGGGTLDVAVVLVEEQNDQLIHRSCRIVGKAGADIGGATIDQWLFQHILKQNRRSDSDDSVRRLSCRLLTECERAKERLSFQDHTEIVVHDAGTGLRLNGEITRRQFEEFFQIHDAFTEIEHTIRRALNAGRERGFSEEGLKSVLMIGGSSLIPSVQKILQDIFGRERVRLQRPLDAVARGAAALVAGVELYDHIQHDYAIRHVQPDTVAYQYHIIVPKGTPYPTLEAIARITVRGSYDNQGDLGLAVFELGDQSHGNVHKKVELVFDHEGSVRIRPVTNEDDERRYYFWINEKNPTFLHADPPAHQGEARFEVEFKVDANKRLLVTARDLKMNILTYKDFPVIKLS